jgi:predicted enzyme related to lactoylglutathione lyase
MSTITKSAPERAGANGRGIDRRRVMAGVTAVAAATATSAVAQSPAKAQTAPSDADVGTVWWSELLTRNPERARAFYARVIGWTPKIVALEDTSRPPKQGEREYTLFMVDGREGAGAMMIQDDPEFEGVAPSWLTYIQVANVDAAALQAAQLGGKVVTAPFDVPKVGRIAVVQDLEGARVGLVTPIGRANR